MTWDSALAGGVVALGGKILWDWLTHRGGTNGGNGKAGDQPRIYYDSRFDSLESTLRDGIERQKDIHRIVIQIAARQRHGDD